jgi:predicted ArsR family transcriptional regulator
MSDHISLDEAAAALGLSREALRKRLQRGTVAGFVYKGAWRVDLDSVQAAAARTSTVQLSTATSRTDGQDAPAWLAVLHADNERMIALLEAILARVEDSVQPVQANGQDAGLAVQPRRPSILKRLIYGPTGAP